MTAAQQKGNNQSISLIHAISLPLFFSLFCLSHLSNVTSMIIQKPQKHKNKNFFIFTNQSPYQDWKTVKSKSSISRSSVLVFIDLFQFLQIAEPFTMFFFLFFSPSSLFQISTSAPHFSLLLIPIQVSFQVLMCMWINSNLQQSDSALWTISVAT